MRWRWRKSTDGGSAQERLINGSLHALADAGAETVVFVSESTSGTPCEEALRLEGGRIPIRLAETIPLAGCTQKDSCVCRYDELAPAVFPGSQDHDRDHKRS